MPWSEVSVTHSRHAGHALRGQSACPRPQYPTLRGNRTIKNEAKEKPRVGNIRFYPPATRRQANILHRTAKTCTSTPSANNFLPPRPLSAIVPFRRMLITRKDKPPVCRLQLDACWVDDGTVEGEVSQELYWVDTLEEALKDDKKHAVQNSFDMPAGTIGSSSSTKGNGNWSPAPAYSTKRQSGLQSHFTSLSIIPVAK